jgi:hypothetical protein
MLVDDDIPTDARAARRVRIKAWGAAALAVLLAAALLWSGDTVTLQGERTIYTARCVGGDWSGIVCKGRITAGERYRFRALKPHREVVFWTAGATAPSGKFTNCSITDGRNWKCPPNAEAASTITLQMLHGRAVADPSARTLSFHPVAKWRWWMMRLGLSLGSSADS